MHVAQGYSGSGCSSARLVATTCLRACSTSQRPAAWVDGGLPCVVPLFFYLSSSQQALGCGVDPHSYRLAGWHTSAGTLTFILLEGCHGAAPPWGPGPSASVAPLEEASGSLGPRPLSTQARTLHDPPTHLDSVTIPSIPSDASSTDGPSSRRPQSWHSRVGGKSGQAGGLSSTTTWLLGGQYLCSRVCVSYLPIYTFTGYRARI